MTMPYRSERVALAFLVFGAGALAAALVDWRHPGDVGERGARRHVQQHGARQREQPGHAEALSTLYLLRGSVQPVQRKAMPRTGSVGDFTVLTQRRKTHARSSRAGPRAPTVASRFARGWPAWPTCFPSAQRPQKKTTLSGVAATV